MGHPLHLAVADAIAAQIPSGYELVRDPACGGEQHLPLFIGRQKSRRTRMCCVDLLVIGNGAVRALIEIEESGFLPTKVCGKFLQAALSDHFIHRSHHNVPVGYGDSVLFVQVLDGSACLKAGTQKDSQAKLIREEINMLLPVRGVTHYELHFVDGPGDHAGLKAVGATIARALVQPALPADSRKR